MKTKIFTFFTLFLITALFGQINTNLNDSVSIGYQFDNLIEISNRYEDFRVVKTNNILELKSNVMDSISAVKKEFAAAKNEINSQKNTIDSLKTAFSRSEETINTLKNQTQNISFLGIQFNKDVFKTILLSIIAVLTIIGLVFISKYTQSNKITSQALNDLKVLEEEFETHRKNALEREQKVRRELLDEINKHKKDS
jgi:hypothetical protein